MISTGKDKLVVSGLALANPHVGQGVYTLRLVQGLARRLGNQFVVIAPSTIAKPAELGEEQFCAMPPFRAPRNELLTHALASFRLLQFVREKFPGAVFHSPGPITGLISPAKMVVTLHDCLYRHFRSYDGRFFIRKFLSRAAERFAGKAHLVLTDSEFSRDDLIKKAGISPKIIEVLYPWVGPEFLVPMRREKVAELRARLQLPERFWLYLGGYDHRKNVEFLLDAYARASGQKILPTLVLAGKLPTTKHEATCDVVGALTRNRLTTDRVIQAGAIPAADLADLYRAASLLVFPSLGEGFGLPPAEAMAVGCPVLISKRTSLPEVVRNPGSLFDPTSASDLIEKLLAAAEDEQQFGASLSPEFTEGYAITRYLKLLDLKIATRE